MGLHKCTWRAPYFVFGRTGDPRENYGNQEGVKDSSQVLNFSNSNSNGFAI